MESVEAKGTMQSTESVCFQCLAAVRTLWWELPQMLPGKKAA